jgi:hypothetical protein
MILVEVTSIHDPNPNSENENKSKKVTGKANEQRAEQNSKQATIEAPTTRKPVTVPFRSFQSSSQIKIKTVTDYFFLLPCESINRVLLP